MTVRGRGAARTWRISGRACRRPVYDLRSDRHGRCHMNRARGFTLIEIAVVLFIIALLAGAIAQYLSGQITSAKQALTQTREASIKAALTNFVSRNYRLPCPAVATIPAGAANNGVEAINPGTCTGTVLFPAVTPIVATGTIPWVSLGLPAEGSIDGYGNRFTYQVTLTATSNALTAQTLPGLKGNITIHSSGPAVAGNQINDCTPVSVPPVTYNPCSAVVVVVSHGTNGFGAYMDSGVQMPLPPGADEQENTNADNTFVMKAFSGAQANPYDDTVVFMTAGDILAGLNNSGALQDYRAIVAADFNVIRNALIANVTRAGKFPVRSRHLRGHGQLQRRDTLRDHAIYLYAAAGGRIGAQHDARARPAFDGAERSLG
jgi:prepilin-type N-terminal cleavage/methylation domain-containing protein